MMVVMIGIAKRVGRRRKKDLGGTWYEHDSVSEDDGRFSGTVTCCGKEGNSSVDLLWHEENVDFWAYLYSS